LLQQFLQTLYKPHQEISGVLSAFQNFRGKEKAVQHCKLPSDFASLRIYVWYLYMLNYIWLHWINNTRNKWRRYEKVSGRANKN